MSDIYKSKEQIMAELHPLIKEPLAQLIAHIDAENARGAYDTFMGTLAGYYVRGTAEFYNAGVKAERARQEKSR